MLNISLKNHQIWPCNPYQCHAYKKNTGTSNSFMALPRLHATAVDSAHDLINGTGEAGKILQNQ